jgi:hypothetical protein
MNQQITNSLKYIPVFLHIPKNAGTYILSCAQNIFRRYLNELNPNKFRMNDLGYRILLINYENNTISIALCYEPNYLTNKKFKQIPYNEYSNSIELGDFLCEISQGKLKIFSLFIESNGFKFIKTGLFDNLFKIIDKLPLYCAIFRDPLERAASLFSYLKSNQSLHEPTHGAITSNTFENYIKSSQAEDSWLIRSIAGVPNSKGISDEDFEKTCIFLDNVKIMDIKDTDKLIIYSFNTCYSFNVQFNKQIMRTNKIKQNNINLQEMDSSSINIFKNRAAYDYKLYNRYIS